MTWHSIVRSTIECRLSSAVPFEKSKGTFLCVLVVNCYAYLTLYIVSDDNHLSVVFDIILTRQGAFATLTPEYSPTKWERSMSTSTNDDVIDKIKSRKSILSPKEQQITRDHVERRDFGGGSSKPPSDPKLTASRERRSGLPVVVGVLIAMVIAMLIGAVIVLFVNDAKERADKLATAQRELQGYADTLNKKLPAGNQVVINSVTYKSGGFETMIVKVTQGKTVCTAQVYPPDDKHHLYWSSHLGEVPVDQIESADYKCIESVGWPGMGDI